MADEVLLAVESMYVVSYRADSANTNATGMRYITHMNPPVWVLTICMPCVNGGEGAAEQGPSKWSSLSVPTHCCYAKM